MRALLLLLITAVILSVYYQVREFSFLNYDDPIYTTDNEVVRKGFTLSGVIWAFTDGTYHTNYWAPLTWITFFIDYELYGMDPGGYHLTNVLFHVLNSLLLFIGSLYLTGSMGKSLLLALFFGIHPLHVESVAWISERKDVVSTFFWMLTLIAYGRYVRKPGFISYSAVLLMFVFCLMGKPMGVTLPFVLLLFDFWPMGRLGSGPAGRAAMSLANTRQLVWEKLPLFACVAILLPLTFHAQGQAGALKSLEAIPFFFRLENVLVAYASQVLKTFCPVNLGILYPYPDSLPLWKSATSFFFLAGITALVLKLRQRSPYLIVGWLWFLGTLVPVAGFLVIGPHVTADRYTYIPLVGLFYMVIWGVDDLRARFKINRQAVMLLAALAVFVLTGLTWKQVGYWKNNLTIYARTLAVTENNWPVHFNLGTAYREKRMESKALEHFQKALRIRPDIVEAQLSVGDVLMGMGRIGAAVSHYEDAVQILPQSAALHTALAVSLDRRGLADQAVTHFLKAITIDNDFAEAYHGLGVVRMRQGQVDRAIARYRQALDIDGEFAVAHNNLGVALVEKGELSEACTRLKAAIAVDPEYAEPHYVLGVISLNNGDKKAAYRHFSRALQIDPEHASALTGRHIAAGE